MEQKETRFSYVYRNLKNRIINGELLPGSRLSSSRLLCDEYQVGMRTITDVLAALKADGLIEMQPRRAAVVTKWSDRDESSKEREILKIRECIVQVYETYTLLLPPMLTFASQDCDIEALPHYKQAQKAARKGIAGGGWRTSAALSNDILRSSGNLWLCELHSLFQLYGNLTFFTEEYPYFSKTYLEGAISASGFVLHVLNGKDTIKKFRLLTDVYQKLYGAVTVCMQRLETEYPECPVQTAVDFRWNALRGQDYYYLRITQDLENKIGIGTYPAGTFLPHEAQLAGQYGVSVSTIRKAQMLLEQRGFSKTLNVKGTLVMTPDDSNAANNLQNSTTKQAALRYLYALQLMTLIIQPVALRTAPRLTREDLEAMSREFTKPDRIYLTDILQYLVKRLDLTPMRVIFIQACKLTQWGYYIAFYKNKHFAIHSLNRKSLMAFRYLQSGDISGFAVGLADCYRHILDAVRKYMVEKYRFQDALVVRTPPKMPVDACEGLFSTGQGNTAF